MPVRRDLAGGTHRLREDQAEDHGADLRRLSASATPARTGHAPDVAAQPQSRRLSSGRAAPPLCAPLPPEPAAVPPPVPEVQLILTVPSPRQTHGTAQKPLEQHPVRHSVLVEHRAAHEQTSLPHDAWVGAAPPVQVPAWALASSATEIVTDAITKTHQRVIQAAYGAMSVTEIRGNRRCWLQVPGGFRGRHASSLTWVTHTWARRPGVGGLSW